MSRLNGENTYNIPNSENKHEIFVSKKSKNINSQLTDDLINNLGIKGLKSVEVYSNHVVGGLNDQEFEQMKNKVLSEAPVDNTYTTQKFEEKTQGKTILTVIEAKPGQHDPTVELIDYNAQLITKKETKNRYKHVLVLEGEVSEEDQLRIKRYIINPNENFESTLADRKLEREIQEPKNNIILSGFNSLNTELEFKDFIKKNGLPIEIEDAEHIQKYFKEHLNREPTKVEMLLIGTYWSDHCRHTTFETQIDNLSFKGTAINLIEDIKAFNGEYTEKKKEIGKEGENTFMQIAKSSLAFLKTDPDFKGLEFIDESEEDNAASYKLQIELEDGSKEDWIIMFKNETHNSPTEAEPFGGSATALGGSIRDLLSGRSTAFACMRVSGAGDPTKPVSEALAGKLSQLALSIGSALGSASYGNQIGVASTSVQEYFHPGHEAKRFELSYVLGAVKEENLIREAPVKDDIVIMAGGLTGRDGVGGAVVSSSESGVFDDEALGAHVQKGNPLNQRTFQRLMKKYPELTKMIKKCNDFGAGGVAVALGELARGINIDLDEVAKHVKYQGLTDEELMISESQERMAFVIDPKHKERFLEILALENINAFQAGEVTTESEIPKNSEYSKEELQSFKELDKKSSFENVDGFINRNEKEHEDLLNKYTKKTLKQYLKYNRYDREEYETYAKEARAKDRLVVNYKGKKSVDLPRDFLDTNGTERHHDATIIMDNVDYFETLDAKVSSLIKKGKFLEAVKLQLSFIENSSQRALQEGYDQSVGSTAVSAPYGGKYGDSPQGKKMVNKIPVEGMFDSKTALISSHGYNPVLMSQNTYIGGMYSIIEAISAVVATGGDYQKSWMSLQEYFGKLTDDDRYGEVYAGLLGTLKALTNFKVPAIGGKDSMSGTYFAKLQDLWKLRGYKGEKLSKLFKRTKEYFKLKDVDGVKQGISSIVEEFVSLRIDVPPSIVAFANCPIDSKDAISSEFKQAGHKVLHFKIQQDENGVPDFEKIKSVYEQIHKLSQGGKVFSSSVLANGGIIESISKLSLGNRIGFTFNNISTKSFTSNIGDILIEVDTETAQDFDTLVIGETTEGATISFGNESLDISEAKTILEGSLKKVWDPEKPTGEVDAIPQFTTNNNTEIKNVLKENPIALIPVFPGTNSEDDTKHQLEKAGFTVTEHVFNTVGTLEEQKQSRIEFAEKLEQCNLFVLAGGFSFEDKPTASGITAVNILKSDEIKSSVQNHYDNGDKRTVGVCNGSQKVIKMGFGPNGEIKDSLDKTDPIIAHNDSLKHATGLVRVKVTSILGSAFFTEEDLGKEYMVNISHSEGKYIMSDEKLNEAIKNGTIALQYLDEDGNPTNKYNGSISGIAGMTDDTGRILYMMPHPERIGLNVMKNIPGDKEMPIFENLNNWFRTNDKRENA